LPLNGGTRPISGYSSGTIGLFIDGYRGPGSGGVYSNIYSDYGSCCVFMHGMTSYAPAYGQNEPNSNTAGISLTNCRSNRGPGDIFGNFRIEDCVNISRVGVDAGNYPAWSSATAYADGARVVSAGVVYSCSAAVGPTATLPASDPTHRTANTIVVAQLVNRSGTGAASLANGTTIIYGNNAGRLNLIDTSRGIGGASI
jgi:hypothetical protein